MHLEAKTPFTRKKSFDVYLSRILCLDYVDNVHICKKTISFMVAILKIIFKIIKAFNFPIVQNWSMNFILRFNMLFEPTMKVQMFPTYFT